MIGRRLRARAARQRTSSNASPCSAGHEDGRRNQSRTAVSWIPGFEADLRERCGLQRRTVWDVVCPGDHRALRRACGSPSRTCSARAPATSPQLTMSVLVIYLLPQANGNLKHGRTDGIIAAGAMNDDDDAALLHAWRDGDRGAGATLVCRYYPLIRRFFANKVARSDEILDLTQCVFEACSENKERIEHAASFRSYLFGIATNTLRRYIDGKVKRRRETLDFSEVCVRDYTDPSVTSILAHRRQQALLIAALRELPLEQQIVVELNKFEYLSGREISELLGVPEGTIRSRLRLAHENLSARVAELAQSPAEHSDTITNLDAWAAEVRRLIDRDGDLD